VSARPTSKKPGVYSSTGGFPPIKDSAGLPVHERDLKTQGAVLDLLLIAAPSVMTAKELEAALADEVALADKGAIGWAVEDLTGMGLLERDGERVRPTPAAIHFHMIGSV
jgi:hypothetical protein